MGRRERDRLVSSVRLIFAPPAESGSFKPSGVPAVGLKTIQRERINVESYLEDTPSLKRILTQDWLAKIYRIARKDAALETDLPLSTFPEQCPYTWEQVLDEQFLP